MLLIKLLKRIVLPTILLFSSIAHAKEIQQQDFLHDFYNTTILHIGMDNGCGTFDLDKYSFIVRGAADFLIDEQDWDLDPTPTFTPSTGWTHVDGEPLDAADYMDYAYKLAAAGDAFVSTTASTNDTGRQGQHFFIINAV